MERITLSDRIEYRVNGKLHRLDGPAVESSNGDKEWWVNGNLHRLDGPAVERASGDKQWWVNNERHRLDGPAVEYANGSKEWWVNNEPVTEKDVKNYRPSIRARIGSLFFILMIFLCIAI